MLALFLKNGKFWQFFGILAFLNAKFMPNFRNKQELNSGMKASKFSIRQEERGGRRYFTILLPAAMSTTGKQKRLYFPTRAEAQAERTRLLELVRAGEGAGLTAAEQEDARAALRVLRESGFEESLLEFVRRGVRVLARAGARMTVAQLCAEVEAFKAHEWGDRSLRSFRWLARKAAEAFGERPLLEVGPVQLEGWLLEEFPHTVSRSNAIATLRPAWSYAVRRGYLESSPFDRVAKPRKRAREVAIFTPQEVRQIMEACPPDCVAAFALMVFAGIRPAEVTRLRWADVRLQEGFVHVAAAKSKTAQARNVEVLPVLRAWLLATGQHEPHSAICPPCWSRKVQAVRKGCGVEFRQQDMLRHTFASYHLCEFQNEGRTKVAMGHSRASDTLFVHYRAVATKAAAAAFWGLYPSAEG